MGFSYGCNMPNATFIRDNTTLIEGDVTTKTINGIPSIKFSDRVLFLMEKIMFQTIILKLLGRKIGYNTLLNQFLALWKTT